jgi:hypothetical protein
MHSLSLEDLLQDIIEKKTRLEELRKSSPETAQAIEAVEDYSRQYAELERRLASPTIIPMPYPVYPPVYPTPNWFYSPPVYPPKQWISVTCGASVVDTTSSLF